jgi:Domain of unknown function (DUF4198)
MLRRLIVPAAIALAAALGSGPAAAHDNWLEVEPFFSPAPGKAKVYLLSGEQFEAAEPLAPRRKDRYSKFQIISSTGKKDATADLREDTPPLAVISAGAKAQGTFVLALDAAPRTIEIAAPKFQDYLLEERLIDMLLYRAGRGQEDAPGRERYTRFLKAVMQIGPRLDPVVTQPTGQDLEIVPLSHPYALVPGAILSVQVLFKGRPLAGRAVTAANRLRSDVVKKTLRTDANGKVNFPIGRVGDWMLRLIHMEPSAESDVEWRSYWANLTFSLPDPQAR